MKEKRRVRGLIPEEGELGLGDQLYLQSFESCAFEQSYRGTALRMWVASANLSIEQSLMNISPLDARKMDTTNNLI